MAEVSNPKVIIKKKQVSVLVDYCLEEAIEFSVKQQSFPDTDWEIEMKLKDFKAAVLLGMFLRENRIDIDGIEAEEMKLAEQECGNDEALAGPKRTRVRGGRHLLRHRGRSIGGHR